MCRSIQSVLVIVCVVTLSHHIQLGKSQNDGKCKKKKQFPVLYIHDNDCSPSGVIVVT